MYPTPGGLIEALLLTTALSCDAFVSCLAYGAGSIRIPPRSAFVVSLISSGILTASLTVGQLINPLLSQRVTGLLCFLVLCLLGVLKLFDSAIKALINRICSSRREIHFSVSRIRFILQVYANPEAADSDASRELSVGEAMSLAAALSLDSLAVGLGAGIGRMSVLTVFPLSLIVGLGAIAAGAYIGRRISDKVNINLDWLCGCLLILLGVLKL